MSKYIICLGDGMADEPLDYLGDKTPLQAAQKPNIDYFAQKGKVGLVHTVPQGMYPGSDVANMAILGYDPRDYYTGRGPIEAAAMTIQVPQGLMVFRCNLVTIEDGIMKDFTSGHISNDEGAALFKELSDHFPKDTAQFFPGVGYRNIILVEEKFANLKCTAPHDITDKPVEPFLPKGPLENEMLAFIKKCQEILQNSKVNQERLKQGKSPATSIWPWSQGPMPKMPSFKETHHKTGGIVTAVDLLRGLAQLTGLEFPYVEGATGFLDTNYKGKMDAAFDILDRHDFVYIHIEAPDECGHMGDGKLKTKAIEDFDTHVIAKVKKYVEKNPDTHVLILPDHPTPCYIKTHSHAPVPFVWYSPDQEGPHADTYNEKSAQNTGLEIATSWGLTSEFLKKVSAPKLL